MFDRLRTRWRAFLALRSGTRFRRQHRRRQARPHPVRTLLAVAGGLLLILAGIAMLVLPGPGLLVIAIGAALIAGESLTVARLLDRVDFCTNVRYQRWRRRREAARRAR
ncbi:MAG: PGPGW domain-containing protein [Rudaea sp.]|uniref:PGPGW domain-containing protein n=1 Tax=Rudaea sp. TaxID=2136325 RepID=UPI0039E54867